MGASMARSENLTDRLGRVARGGASRGGVFIRFHVSDHLVALAHGVADDLGEGSVGDAEGDWNRLGLPIGQHPDTLLALVGLVALVFLLAVQAGLLNLASGAFPARTSLGLRAGGIGLGAVGCEFGRQFGGRA